VTPERRRVVLDCDPGHDDALAILLAASSPAIELEAITTVAGNQTLERVTLNARRICSVAGIHDVPIAAGSDRPLRRDPIVAEAIHGSSGLDGVEWDEPEVSMDARHGVDLLVERALADDPRPLTVIAVGPLTNVAAALARDPSVASGIERIAVMGGAIGLGNVTPSAEFNIHADPEAAAAVIGSGVPVTLVPLEVTHLALATDDVLARIASLGTRTAEVSVALMRYFADTYRRVFGFEAPAVHDPCAVATVIDPTLVPARSVHVEVDTTDGPSAGRTACDVYGITGRTANLDLGIDLEVERFWDAMIAALATYP
jgi:inosine-uridine nucleoside N-ribohydrolase